MTNLREIIKSLRLPPAARAEAERLIDLPAVRQAFDDLDAAAVTRRRELVALIASAEARQATAKAGATAALRDAEKRLATAQAALEAATDAHRLAFAHSLNGAEAATKREIATATAELVAGADPRVTEFKRHTLNLQEGLRLAVDNRIGMTAPNFLGHRQPVYSSNTTEVQVAMDVCRECLAELDALRLTALTRAEITERLGELSERLSEAVHEFDLPRPVVDEHGAVVVTRPGARAPDVLRERQAKADEREAVQAERAAAQG